MDHDDVVAAFLEDLDKQLTAEGHRVISCWAGDDELETTYTCLAICSVMDNMFAVFVKNGMVMIGIEYSNGRQGDDGDVLSVDVINTFSLADPTVTATVVKTMNDHWKSEYQELYKALLAQYPPNTTIGQCIRSTNI